MRKRKFDIISSSILDKENVSVEKPRDNSEDTFKLTDAGNVNKNIEGGEEIFRFIFDCSGVGTSIINTDGSFIKINKTFAEILEYPVDHLQKMNFSEIMHPSELEEILHYIEACDKEETIRRKQFEKKLIKKGRKIFWGLITIAPVRDTSGKLSYFILQLQDITQRKNNELELASYANKLSELNIAKDKFFSIISHDLRNPFNSLLGVSEYAAQFFDELSKQEIKDAVNNIHLSSKKVYNLMMNLLEWARIQTGRLDIDKTKLDLLEITESVLELYAETAMKKSVLLINEIKNHINLFADRYMVETVLRNLISNAIKFTHRNGSVIIKSDLKDDYAVITVHDTGVGINPENQGRLFCIDKQLHTSGTENETGTGLGLILCKEFVEKNGGTITLESEPNRGSKFMFTVPLFTNQ